MRLKFLTMFILLGLLAATSAFGQFGQGTVTANIQFQFTVGKTVFPAGQYRIVPDETKKTVEIIRAGAAGAVVPVITQLAAAIHTTKDDAHLVFDKVGETYWLSEIWSPGVNGLLLTSTRQEHEHRIINVPMP